MDETILGIKLTKKGIQKILEILEMLERENTDTVEVTFDEGFEAHFLTLEKPVQFYSIHSIFSDDRMNLIKRINDENKVHTKYGDMYPIVFLLPVALLDEDLEIMREGGFEFRKRIEGILRERGIKVDNPDDFLNDENQAKTLKVLAEEVEKGNLTANEVFWYFLVVYIAGGYSVLKMRERENEDNNK